MKILHHPNRDDIHLTSVLHALSDPIRLSIVKELAYKGEMTCSHFSVPVAKSTLSHHTRTLRESGVVFTRVQGTQLFLTIRHEDLNTRFPGLLTAVLNASDPAELPSVSTAAEDEA